jgi:4-hydroxybenzoate polyprenyltransferase
MLHAWLRVTRLPLAATAVCDSAACAMLALGAAGLPLSTFAASDWLLLGCTSLLVYLMGMAANDLADREIDAQREPNRPIPSGVLSARTVALGVTVLATGAILLGGGPQGSVWVVAAAITCAFLYDFLCRSPLAAAAASMGSVRFANASIAVWPLVLSGAAPWSVLLGPLCVGVYSAGVTILSTTEDLGPGPVADKRVWVARFFSAGTFVCAATLVWALGGVPTLGVMVAFGVASSSLFGRTPRTTVVQDGETRPRPAKAQVLEMLLGLYWLAAVLAGGGHDGTLQQAVIVSFIALIVAWALAIGSQLMIRKLRK